MTDEELDRARADEMGDKITALDATEMEAITKAAALIRSQAQRIVELEGENAAADIQGFQRGYRKALADEGIIIPVGVDETKLATQPSSTPLVEGIETIGGAALPIVGSAALDLPLDGEVVERVKALEEALTPSNETKAAYMGEFQFPFCVGHLTYTPNVPWITIKKIMAAILARASHGVKS